MDFGYKNTKVLFCFLDCVKGFIKLMNLVILEFLYSNNLIVKSVYL